VRIIAVLSRASVTYGTPVTLSGTLFDQPVAGGDYMPFPGQAVAVYSSLAPARPVATLTTGRGGSFRLSLPDEGATTTWTLVAGAALGTPHEGTATAELTEAVRVPTTFPRFSVTLDQDGRLDYSGCLGLSAGVPAVAPVQLTRPALQYAARPKGPWRTLAGVALSRTPCGNGGEEFYGRAASRLNLAYYRAYFPGCTGTLGTGYLRSASPARLAWKFADRIASFTARPATAPRKGELTVAGTLQYYYRQYHYRPAWNPYAGQPVLIILRPLGQRTWYWITQVTTGPDGWFSATFADPLSATWSAEYLGSGTHLATIAAMIYVRVR
jgi:hypothetical protein